MKPETLLFDVILNDLDAVLNPAGLLFVKESDWPRCLSDLMIKIESECQTVTDVIFRHNKYNIKYLCNEVNGIIITKLESLEEIPQFTPEQIYAIRNLDFDLGKEPYNKIGTHHGVDYFITQLVSLKGNERKFKALDLLRTTFSSYDNFDTEELKLTSEDYTYSQRENSMRRSIHVAIFQDLKDSYKIEIDRLQEIEIGYEELGNKVTDTYNQTSAAIRELQRLFLFDKDNYKLIGHYELCFQEYFKGVSQIIKGAFDKNVFENTGAIVTPGVEITPDFINKEIRKINHKFTLSTKEAYYRFYIILAQTALDIISRIAALKVSEQDKNKQQAAGHEPKRSAADKRMANNDFSHKQIAIAHFCMGIIINTKNAAVILKKFSKNKSVAKLIQNVISKSSEITSLSQHKATDTKHSNDLLAAKRLISGTRDKKAETDISRYIQAFEASREAFY